MSYGFYHSIHGCQITLFNMTEFRLKPKQYGPCGLYCSACGASDCGGCRSDDIDEYIIRCKFRNCVKEKGLDFCCYCADYPCKELRDFMRDEWPHHWTMAPNLEYIRKYGVDKWLEAQAQKWLCKTCGANIYWYQKTCGCGKELEAFEIPKTD